MREMVTAGAASVNRLGQKNRFEADIDISNVMSNMRRVTFGRTSIPCSNCIMFPLECVNALSIQCGLASRRMRVQLELTSQVWFLLVTGPSSADKTPEQADKMLDAAVQLFGRRRFHEVRIDDIAAEAEVGKGTLYRYFTDKEELYVALLTRSARQYSSSIDTGGRESRHAREEASSIGNCGVFLF